MKDFDVQNMELILAGERDAETIWKMQKVAFAELLRKYRDYDTNPASEPIERVARRLTQPNSYYYFIVFGGEKIGAIRVVDKKSDYEAKRISPLFILPQYRNRGYAQEAILQVEKIHGEKGWELETILQEAANCRLYERAGYRRTDELTKINQTMTLVKFIK